MNMIQHAWNEVKGWNCGRACRSNAATADKVDFANTTRRTSSSTFAKKAPAARNNAMDWASAMNRSGSAELVRSGASVDIMLLFWSMFQALSEGVSNRGGSM